MSAADNLNPKQFVAARDLQVGHKIDRRSRISKIKVDEERNRVLAQTKVQGAKSPGISQWDADEQVRIY
jgi:hypothetical protein